MIPRRRIVALIRLGLIGAACMPGLTAPHVSRGADSAPFSTATDRFTAGCEAYDRRDYAAARDGFLALAREGFIDTALYFNLGNSYYRLSELPHAVLWYERARRLAPSDPDIRTNLRIAREDLGLIDPERERQLAARANPLTLFTEWLRARRPDQWRAIALAAYWILAGLALPVLLRRTTWPWVRWPAAMAVVALVLGACGLAVTSADLTGPPYAIVLEPVLPARYAPLDDARVRFELRGGEPVRVVERTGGWLRVRRPDATEDGYIPRTTAAVIAEGR